MKQVKNKHQNISKKKKYFENSKAIPIKLILQESPTNPIWNLAGDYFDYKNVEWYRYAVYTDKEQAETELKKLRKEAGGEYSIIKFRLQEEEVK